MTLRVLSIAFPFAPIGPRGVGGAEKILAGLDAALVGAGHESFVIACEGSEVRGELIPVPLPQILDETAQRENSAYVQAAIDRVFATRAIDLVHMHGLDFHRYAIPQGVPVLVTLHLPVAWYPADAWSFRQPVQFCCVSHSQRATCPPELRDAIVIENGVSIPALPPVPNKENYALVLGRICPEKNAHEALEAGTRARISIWLAGNVYPYREHQQYFAEKIQPLLGPQLNGVQHCFLGSLSPAELEPLLARARCLLHPTLAPETSSLVAMEALAAGTPVVAYPSGALPEIVDDGITGYLVNNVEEMAAAIRNVAHISRLACRAAAERRFDIRRMTQTYLDLYASLAHPVNLEPLHA